MALNSQKSTCFFLPSCGIIHVSARLVSFSDFQKLNSDVSRLRLFIISFSLELIQVLLFEFRQVMLPALWPQRAACNSCGLSVLQYIQPILYLLENSSVPHLCKFLMLMCHLIQVLSSQTSGAVSFHPVHILSSQTSGAVCPYIRSTSCHHRSLRHI